MNKASINSSLCVCGNPAKCRGYCSSCYNKLLLEGKFDESLQLCSVKNCHRRIKGRTDNSTPLCNAHYSKWYRVNKQAYNYDKKRYTKRKEQLGIAKNKLRTSISGRYTRGKSQAKKDDKVWLLSKKFYTNLIEPDKCYYNCGNPLNKGGYSLDRKDNSIGYTEDNVIPCCWQCNSLRNKNLTVEETVEVIKFIKKLRNKENIWE